MTLFRKPVAIIYVNELRQNLDPKVVPVFTPDTPVEVGDFGSYEGGRFVRLGNLADRLPFAVEKADAAPFTFASQGKVSIGPSVMVPGGASGGGLVKAHITFSGSRAVVASFAAGTTYSVPDGDLFGKQLGKLWNSGGLLPDRVVVWSVRHATSGTVLIAQESGGTVEITADAAQLGTGGISLAGLSAGVTFGALHKVAWEMSYGSAALTVWARILRYPRDQAQPVHGFGYQDSRQLAAPLAEPVPFTSDDLLKLLAD